MTTRRVASNIFISMI